jgi:GNAT superfamily N-acetyltransferase
LLDVQPADNRKLFNRFLKFPFDLYRDNPYWVPPLFSDMKRRFSPDNPFFRHAEVQPFISMLDGRPAGRIAAIHNRGYNEFSGENAGFFGFFDCIEDDRVAKALVDEVSGWLRQRGATFLRGPMNFTSNDEWGVLIDGFDSSPMVMMPYNHPYYGRLLESCGLVRAKDLYAYIADVPDTLPEKVHRVAGIAMRRGISVRPVDMRNFRREMAIFREIYNAAWERNWGFMPMTDEEIEHTADDLRRVMVPELSLIAFFEGKPVGFMMFLPDMNQVLKRLRGRMLGPGLISAIWHSRRIRDARLLLLGIRPGFRRRGVDSVLFIEALKGLRKKGFKRMEFSWILEDNYPVQRIIETMGGRLYKKYRVYERELGDE